MVDDDDYKSDYAYTGIGQYEIGFTYYTSADISVKWISDDGVLSAAKVEGVDYTVITSGAAAYVNNLVNFGTGGTITLFRDMELTQPWRGSTGSDYDGGAAMRAIDRIVRLVQQVSGAISGTLKAPANESGDMTIPSAAARRGSALGFEDTAEALPYAIAGTSSVPVSTFMEAPLTASDGDEFCGDVGAATSDELSTIEDQAAANLEEAVATSSLDRPVHGLEVIDASVISTTGRIVALSPTRIVMAVPDVSSPPYVGLGIYDYLNGAWTLTGTPHTLAFENNDAICAMSETSIAIIEMGTGDLKKYTLSGGVWSVEGNEYDTGVVAGFGAITALSSSRVVVCRSTDNSIQAYDFDGNNWATVGSSISPGSMSGQMDIEAMSDSSIAFASGTLNAIRKYVFSGTAWALEGASLTVSMGTLHIAAFSSKRIATSDSTNDNIQVYDFGEGVWVAVGTEIDWSADNVYGRLAVITTDTLIASNATHLNLQTIQIQTTGETPAPPFQ